MAETQVIFIAYNVGRANDSCFYPVAIRVKAISFSPLLPACDASCVDSSFFLFYEGMVRAR